MRMQLVEGPFKSLDGRWRFTEIRDAQSVPRGTRVELSIQFQFKSAMLDMLMGKAFESSCGSLVEAFGKRARALYGPVSL
jgi:ribosome-associated toxin RatA of RatAB toxin-antitoxin module